MRKHVISRGFKSSIIILLAMVFLLGLVLSGPVISAQNASSTPMLFGQVTSVAGDGASFNIQTDSQTQATVKVSGSTTYSIVSIPASALTSLADLLEVFLGEGNLSSVTGLAGLFTSADISTKNGAFKDITVGDTVTVSNSSSGVTTQVMVMKFPDVKRVRGMITAVAGNTITITPPDGNAVTINWDARTRVMMRGIIAIRTGQIASAFYADASKLAAIVIIRTTATPTPTASPTASPAGTPQSVSVDASFTGQSVNIPVNGTLLVTLPSNPSTGFSWQLVRVSDTSVLQNTNHQANPAPSPAVPGQAGTEVWTFQAQKAGTSAILMEYSQPWEGGTKGAQTFSLTVIVK